MVKIAVSILNADMKKIDDEIKRACDSNCDMIHIDVMDGRFVTNKTDGKYMMKHAIKSSNKPIDVHLMVNNPYTQIKHYLKADCIIFHIEAVDEKTALKIINCLKENNVKIGISIKPNTETNCIEKYINMIDKVLIMTVEPGYGGQKLIAETLDKVKVIREENPEIDIEVDGGINEQTANMAIEAGANILVAGTALFNSENMKDTINVLKGK